MLTREFALTPRFLATLRRSNFQQLPGSTPSPRAIQKAEINFLINLNNFEVPDYAAPKSL
jgi:hypothetical protein